ncbi:hypothetical protein [Acinetobacter baumannii]|uniref:hypothetical protein n=1 Tax=Acinetobacter baumannii TaxID=470 RepID=UPI000D38A794|nr:hypothetical protein [Acinetobacter baumannii]ELA7823141.1 hypothetical protein [Acinetobacter baumannii]MDC4360929.1 hypothetical protein [Acinetobacter baumannii]MDC5269393.1 hypothetical protein [Acinetobacter baumannii]MDC5371875.1 hypothetical protein [Acinetobacter baumannii]MDV7505666.1 hypothetical protein [Acinetobacter baumannii]
MKKIITNQLNLENIPLNYKWNSFVQFALSFDPKLEMDQWSESDYINPSRLPTESDSIIGLRGYLYQLQRVNNQDINDENTLKFKVEKAYSLLREKLREF